MLRQGETGYRLLGLQIVLVTACILFLLAGASYGQSVVISTAKTLAPNASVQIDSVVVTAAWTDYFYVEDGNRTAGIRVSKAAHGLSVGAAVNITGTIGTNADGEVYVNASTITPAGNGSIKPIAMINRLVGAGDYHYNAATQSGQRGVKDGFGLNNIGMLIITSGRVTYADNFYFTIDDGSVTDDGFGHTGIRVSTNGMSAPSLGQFVTVTGISSCINSGSYLFRNILLRGINDLMNHSGIRVSTFQYIGTGQSGLNIDIGFQPVLVMIKPETDTAADQPVWKTPLTFSYAPAPHWSPVLSNAIAHNHDSIIGFWGNGITLGTSTGVNAAGRKYYGVAFYGDRTQIAYGNYQGDNRDGREIYCGFRPAFVLVKRDNSYYELYRCSQCAENNCHYGWGFKSVSDGTGIKSFTPNGFTVGTTPQINDITGEGYSWFAFSNTVDEFCTVKYTGNSTAGRNITVPGFRPAFTWIKTGSTTSNLNEAIRFDLCTGTNSTSWGTNSWSTNKITDFIPSGFQVGTDNSANRSNDEYHAFCWKPNMVQMGPVRGPEDGYQSNAICPVAGCGGALRFDLPFIGQYTITCLRDGSHHWTVDEYRALPK